MNNSFQTSKKYFSENLRKIMKNKDITQKKLSEKLNEIGIKKGQGAIATWTNKELKKVSVPTSDVIEALCNILDCDKSELIYGSQKPHPSFLEVTKRKFPVLGEVAAGKPIYMNEDRDCYIMADSEINADYCLIARGDSMVDLGIEDGDIVFIKQTDQLRDGEVDVVAIDEEATLKRIRYDKLNNQITLISENKKYPPMIYKDEQLEHIHILGKAVFYQAIIK